MRGCQRGRRGLTTEIHVRLVPALELNAGHPEGAAVQSYHPPLIIAYWRTRRTAVGVGEVTDSRGAAAIALHRPPFSWAFRCPWPKPYGRSSIITTGAKRASFTRLTGCGGLAGCDDLACTYRPSSKCPPPVTGLPNLTTHPEYRVSALYSSGSR